MEATRHSDEIDKLDIPGFFEILEEILEGMHSSIEIDGVFRNRASDVRTDAVASTAGQVQTRLLVQAQNVQTNGVEDNR